MWIEYFHQIPWGGDMICAISRTGHVQMLQIKFCYNLIVKEEMLIEYFHQIPCGGDSLHPRGVIHNNYENMSCICAAYKILLKSVKGFKSNVDLSESLRHTHRTQGHSISSP